MGRVLGRGLVYVIVALAAMPLAYAGMPRGAIVSADEQDANAETGVTIARGNAEISIEKSRILGRADTIEINPAAKKIQFNGRAVVTMGAERYQGEAVTCSLDFNRCANGETASTAPESGVVHAQPSQQSLPPPAALGADAGVTSPR